MQDRTLTFYISGLLPPFKHVAGLELQLSLQGAPLLLSRARFSANSIASYEAGVLTLAGFDEGLSDQPVAALTSLVDFSNDEEGRYLRADPVFLQPNRDEIVMLGGASLNLSRDEIDLLRDEFNRLFADDGLTLKTPPGERWYLQCDEKPQITTTPIYEVLGKNIHTHLPKGNDALYWHGVLNEVQMLFYNSVVNQQRRSQGLPEVNGLWFWGGGELPEGVQSPWQTVWANDVLAQGIAKFYACQHSTLPEDFADWAECAEGGAHFVAFDGAGEALAKRDLATWQRIVQEIDQGWIVPALEALRRGEVGGLSLVTEGARFDLGKKELKRWWKRRRFLSSYAD